MNQIEKLMILDFIQNHPTLCTLIAKSVALGGTKEDCTKIIQEKSFMGSVTAAMAKVVCDYFYTDAGRGLLIELEAHRNRTNQQEPDADNGADVMLDQAHADAQSVTCFSCGGDMTLAPSEVIYECECGYWCYTSS